MSEEGRREVGSYLLGDEEEEETVADQSHAGDQGEDHPGEEVLQPLQALVTHSARLESDD